MARGWSSQSSSKTAIGLVDCNGTLHDLKTRDQFHIAGRSASRVHSEALGFVSSGILRPGFPSTFLCGALVSEASLFVRPIESESRTAGSQVGERSSFGGEPTSKVEISDWRAGNELRQVLSSSASPTQPTYWLCARGTRAGAVVGVGTGGAHDAPNTATAKMNAGTTRNMRYPHTDYAYPLNTVPRFGREGVTQSYIPSLCRAGLDGGQRHRPQRGPGWRPSASMGRLRRRQAAAKSPRRRGRGFAGGRARRRSGAAAGGGPLAKLSGGCTSKLEPAGALLDKLRRGRDHVPVESKERLSDGVRLRRCSLGSTSSLHPCD